MIEGKLDRHDARVRHQSVSGFQPDDAAQRRRNPDRAALIAANGQIGLTAGHQHRAAAGRAARGVTPFPGIVHRALGAGVAAAGQAEIFAMRFAEDGPAGVEHAGDNRRIDIRHIAFQRRGADHHWNPGEADIVFQDNGFAG